MRISFSPWGEQVNATGWEGPERVTEKQVSCEIVPPVRVIKQFIVLPANALEVIHKNNIIENGEANSENACPWAVNVMGDEECEAEDLWDSTRSEADNETKGEI